jgi:hypothetical protein
MLVVFQVDPLALSISLYRIVPLILIGFEMAEVKPVQPFDVLLALLVRS